MNKLRPIFQKVFLFLLILSPAAIVAGLLDYRFHHYFWPGFNAARLFGFNNMFDFWSVLEWYTVLLVVFYLVGVVFFKLNAPDKKFKWVYAPIALIFLGVIAARITYNPDLPQVKSFWWQIASQYLSPIAVCLVVIFSLRKQSHVNLLLRVLFITFGILGLAAIFEYFTGALPGASRDFLNRLVWPYIDPFVDLKAESANWLAYLFGPAAILSFIKFTKNKSVLPASVFFISATVLLLSKSYTGIAVSALLIGAWIFLNTARHRKKWVILVFALLLALGIATQYKTPKFQILLGNYKKENSIERRIQIYKFNWEAFKAHPFAGIGPADYQSYFRANQEQFIGVQIPEEEIPPHPHNLITNFWGELGIFGLLAILLIYAKVIWHLLKKPTGNYFYFVLAYPLAHGIPDAAYGLSETSMLFWLIIGVVLAKSEQNSH